VLCAAMRSKLAAAMLTALTAVALNMAFIHASIGRGELS
jgi:hypothetical protein